MQEAIANIFTYSIGIDLLYLTDSRMASQTRGMMIYAEPIKRLISGISSNHTMPITTAINSAYQLKGAFSQIAKLSPNGIPTKLVKNSVSATV